MTSSSQPSQGPSNTRVLVRQVPTPTSKTSAFIRLGRHVWKVTLTDIDPYQQKRDLEINPELIAKTKAAVIRLAQAKALELEKTRQLHFSTDTSSTITEIKYSSLNTDKPQQMQSLSLASAQIQALSNSVLKELGESISAIREGRPLSTGPSSPEEAQIAELAARQSYIGFSGREPLTSFLSNSYNAPITIGAHTYCCAEAAFQAQKCKTNQEKVPFQTMNAQDAITAGKAYNATLGEDWPRKREEIMKRILKAKFSQHPSLKNQLLATGTTYLIGHDKDTYWSDGEDGRGKNRLGALLMEIRKELGGSGVPQTIPDYNTMHF